MNNLKMMIEFIKEISSMIYGKDVLFYDFDSDTWYSREHCRNLELQEVLEWLKEQICFYLNNDEQN